jgi:oligoendopeptidase F
MSRLETGKTTAPSSVEPKTDSLQNTRWNNSNIFTSQEDPRISLSFAAATKAIKSLKASLENFTEGVNPSADVIRKVQDSAMDRLRWQDELLKISTFASMALSVNSKDSKAQHNYFQSRKLLSELDTVLKPVWGFLARLDEANLKVFLSHPKTQELEPEMKQLQKYKVYLRNSSEEMVLQSLSNDGLHSWGNLYNDLSSSLMVEIDGSWLPLSQAANVMDCPDPRLRQLAYKGINKAWQNVEITASYILNSIYGWRLENYKIRSGSKTFQFLDATCFSEKISRETLAALMSATEEKLPEAQESLKIMALESGQHVLNPWDLLIGYPRAEDSEIYTFPEAMKMIIAAFAEFDPEMAQFAQMAWDKGWIDGATSENRRTGGYCTTVRGVSEPRIFMTFEGTIRNVLVLAHELGHAYHAWVMRDLAPGLTNYTAGVAETASIFAETLVRSYLLKIAPTLEAKKQVLWQELVSISSFLINIPSRFDLEKGIMEERSESFLSANRLSTICKESWQKWYGPHLSEYNEYFWASKMHFSMTKISFYNYPYLMGYLFSLGVYNEGQKQGLSFAATYKNLLRETGVLSANELMQKYFNKSIENKEFWLSAIDVSLQSIKQYKSLLSH